MIHVVISITGLSTSAQEEDRSGVFFPFIWFSSDVTDTVGGSEIKESQITLRDACFPVKETKTRQTKLCGKKYENRVQSIAI